MAFSDIIKKTSSIKPAPRAIEGPDQYLPGWGQGRGVLAPANNPYTAPNPVAPPPPIQPTIPINTGFVQQGGGFVGGGIAGGGGAPAPPAAPKTPPVDYTTMNEEGIAIADGTFRDQRSMYAEALKKYLEDYGRQYGNKDDVYSGTLGRDAKTAMEGIGRNRINGLTALSEDFSARGLGKSGMFAKALQEGEDSYNKQEKTITTGLKDARDDLDFRKAKFESDNTNNIKAARQEAIARLMAKQSLT